MTRFATFATAYMAALVLELAEKWRFPGFTAGMLALGVLLISTGITRRTFLLFLAGSTAHSVFVQFPDVANHVNVEIYCNILMMAGLAYSLARPKEFPTDDDVFETMRPVLQATLIVVYAVAGFDKLNTDFLNADVSCVRTLVTDLTRLATLRPLGVPNGLLLATGAVLVPAALLPVQAAGRPLPLLARAGAVGLVALAAGVMLNLGSRIPPAAAGAAITTMALMVIAWELGGGLLLMVPRAQAPVVAFSWLMHTMLSFIGFIDFGALALALLFTFVPARYQELASGPAPVFSRRLSRAQLYFGVCVLSGVFSGLHRRLPAALCFNLGALVLVWPILSARFGPPPRPAWHGISLDHRGTPGWMFVFPTVLLVHGMTPYLGLRTAGNFSMFSNLRTEGPRSNHLLLSSNPLKRWSYQEDVVKIVRIDDRKAAIGYQYQPLEGHELPVVEFRKLVYQWTRAGATVPLAFEYQGRVHTTENIVHDPAWRTAARDWEMRLMDFRVIQREGPNRCRW